MYGGGYLSQFGLGGLIGAAIGQNTPLPSFPSENYWMTQAILVAMQSPGIAAPNPVVGAVIVKDQKVIGQGATKAYGGSHAEAVAIGQVIDKNQLKGSTLYVTLEPCNHHGKQPPCVDAIISSGISRCVVGVQDPFPQVAGAGIERLRSAGIVVEFSQLRPACRAWHYDYLVRCSRGSEQPVFFGKWAQTVDGHLADDQGSSQWITRNTARSYGHWLRQKYDAIMVGAKTVLQDFPSLTARDCPIIVRQPYRIVADPKGRLIDVSAEDQLRLKETTFKPDGTVIIILPIDRSEAVRNSWLAMLGSHLLMLYYDPRQHGENFFGALPKILAEPRVAAHLGRPLSSVYVEGGAALLNGLMRADLISGMHAFIAPGFLGGLKHRIFREDVSHEGLECGHMDRFHLIGSRTLGGDLVMEMVR